MLTCTCLTTEPQGTWNKDLELQGDIDKPTIITGNFNTPLLEIAPEGKK